MTGNIQAHTNYIKTMTQQVRGGFVGWQVWHLITGCPLCVGSTPKSDNTEDLSQFNPLMSNPNDDFKNNHRYISQHFFELDSLNSDF